MDLGRDTNMVDCFYWYDENSSAEEEWEKGRVVDPPFNKKILPIKEGFLSKIKSLFTFYQHK